MTEAEWLAATDARQMLEYLRGGGISFRNLRLFACGCCWLIRSWLPSVAWRDAVEVAARVADGRATDTDLLAALTRAQPPLEPGSWYDTGPPVSRSDHAAAAAWRATAREASHVNALGAAVHAAIADPATRPRQAALLRELVGNPFLRTSVDPAWLAWNGGMVRTLAAAAYEDRDLYRLAILADALEDAGCTDTEILGHLRSPGPHVRGCWAVDLILSKDR
jgi:hypothetical protein